MSQYPATVDDYLANGCGRCPLGGTPDCKVRRWTEQLEYLRQVALDCGLTEEVKWSVPCYTHKGNNILVISALKDYASISFFKGVLLKDPLNILEKPGENTQSARLIKFTSTGDISALEKDLTKYIQEAISNEEAGLEVDFKAKSELEYPAELTEKFSEHPGLEKAFTALTPGRQRGYILHFTQPKQSVTRSGRIEKCIPKIFSGRGFHDK